MPNINKNIIMQAGAAVANATNKAAGLSAATPEPGNIISAIQLVNGGRKIGPNALAHFTESVRNKLLSLLVDMEPIQDFNGYDHPWPSGGGKNMVDFENKSLPFNGTTAYTVLDFGEDKTFSALTLTFFMDGAQYSINSSAICDYLENDGTHNYRIPTAFGLDSANVNTGAFSKSETNITFRKLVLFLGTNYGAYSAGTCSIQLEQGSTATSYAPYSNICPISGRTGLNVYAGPTSAIGDATTYSMDWTSPAGTVYAGSADIVTGDIKAAPYYASYNGETLVGPWVSSMDVYDPEGTPTTGAQVVDLGGAMTEYHITGQDIITLVGDNYIWSDSGDVTITE